MIDHQKLKERLGAIVRMKEGLVSNHFPMVPRHNIHTHHRKMLNVGASSPLNLHRKALQSKLNPSASNSSRSVIAHRSFQSSTKSVTLGDHSAADLQGANNHRPHSFPQNSSLVSFQTEGTLPNGDGHGCDPDSPTVLNIRLASGGVYGSERSYSRARSSQRTYVSVASDSEEEISRSSAPSHKVCNRTFGWATPF